MSQFPDRSDARRAMVKSQRDNPIRAFPHLFINIALSFQPPLFPKAMGWAGRKGHGRDQNSRVRWMNSHFKDLCNRNVLNLIPLVAVFLPESDLQGLVQGSPNPFPRPKSHKINEAK